MLAAALNDAALSAALSSFQSEQQQRLPLLCGQRPPLIPTPPLPEAVVAAPAAAALCSLRYVSLLRVTSDAVMKTVPSLQVLQSRALRLSSLLLPSRLSRSPSTVPQLVLQSFSIRRGQWVQNPSFVSSESDLLRLSLCRASRFLGSDTEDSRELYLCPAQSKDGHQGSGRLRMTGRVESPRAAGAGGESLPLFMHAHNLLDSLLWSLSTIFPSIHISKY